MTSARDHEPADGGGREPGDDSRRAGLPPGLRQLADLLADGLGEFANATLGLDPVGAERLAALEGSRVLVRAHRPAALPGAEDLAFTLQVTGGRLRLLAGATDAPNAIVSGSIPDLVGWAASRGRRSPAGLRIDGDSRLLEALAALATDYSPDLERPLGRIVGPATATRMLAAAEVALAGMRSLLQGAAAGVKQGAGQWFATGAALGGFLDELDDLKQSVDRLAARVTAAEWRAAEGRATGPRTAGQPAARQPHP